LDLAATLDPRALDVGLLAMLSPTALDLAATSDPRALDVGLVAKPCHESVIIK
jgi:hypothetical protein